MTSPFPNTAPRARREVYRSRWMSLREDEIVRADGTPGLYGVLSKADFAIVIPRHDDGSFTLVEQFRYPIGERCVEFPQGADEQQPDIDPLELAKQGAGRRNRPSRRHRAAARTAAPCLRLQRSGHVDRACDRPHRRTAGAGGRRAGDDFGPGPGSGIGSHDRDGRIRDCASVAGVRHAAAYRLGERASARLRSHERLLTRSAHPSEMLACNFMRGCSRVDSPGVITQYRQSRSCRQGRFPQATTLWRCGVNGRSGW